MMRTYSVVRRELRLLGYIFVLFHIWFLFFVCVGDAGGSSLMCVGAGPGVHSGAVVVAAPLFWVGGG